MNEQTRPMPEGWWPEPDTIDWIGTPHDEQVEQLHVDSSDEDA